MAYTPQAWTNSSGGGTPLSAARLNYMETGIDAAHEQIGGGTLVVYASDALDPKGDYKCDGTADEVQVLAAINALPVIGGNLTGTVVLSEGSFSFSSALVLPATADGVRIVGRGGGGFNGTFGTKITMSSGAGPIIDARTNAVPIWVEHVSFLQSSTTAASNCINVGGGLDCTLVGCRFDSEATVAHRGVENTSGFYAAAKVRNCEFRTRGAGLYFYKPYLLEVVDCHLWTRTGATEYAIEIIGDNGDAGLADGWLFRITNCWSDGSALGAVHVSQFACDGIIEGCHFWYDDVPDIFLEDCSGIQVLGNSIGNGDYVGSGIKLDNADNCTVANNLIYSAIQGGGINILDSNSNVVHGNQIIDCGSGTTDTYSGILIDGNSDENLVYGNKVSHNAIHFAAAHLKYGIRIDDATCNDNMVYGNDVKGSYVTTGVSDIGTGTITTASNRT